MNLVTQSDPARIPLGRVGVISNHNYGIHRMIGEARGALDFGFLDEKRGARMVDEYAFFWATELLRVREKVD